ncbi:hypothetical protein Btru_022820 [Bulinus truncatus]|nr:hypothetical protein Btru_022820 [Bulinus truncatus]
MNALFFRQILTFSLGWISYASTYFLRKPLGVIKDDLQKIMHLSTAQLGWLDTALLFPYAFMQMILSPLGETFGSRKTYGMCLMLSALSMISFGYFSSFSVWFLLLFLNGTAQSQCWPNCTKGLLCWFSDSVKNSMFGMFGTCAFAGGIIGTMISVYLQSSYGWRSVYFYPSIFVFLMGLLVLMLYRQPDEQGVEVPGKSTVKGKEQDKSQVPVEQPKLMALWRLPMIPEVSIAVFCLKVVRYCMYMWLPMYLLQALNYSKSMAGIFSTVFEVGGVSGSALIGFALDRYYKDNALRGIALFVLISTAALVMFIFTSSWGILVNSLCMFIAGAFNAGPDILLWFGSIGTCIEGPIIGVITAYFGWGAMFPLMIGLSTFGTIATYRAALIHARVNAATTDFIEGV